MSAGWWAAGLAVAGVAAVCASRYFASGRHGGAGAGATSAWWLIEQHRTTGSAPAPVRTSWSGNLAEALAEAVAEAPTEVLPKVPDLPPSSFVRDPASLQRLLDGLRAL
ncbi:hypothetical protein [Saccharopolyspora cebuensis]|uniref:Uncharacterized protein n=1 Tax=Saccharopolyspora cebuensis TaxID=418759 RepID=A0ABV4CJ16_9PSEU